MGLLFGAALLVGSLFMIVMLVGMLILHPIETLIAFAYVGCAIGTFTTRKQRRARRQARQAARR